jgi:hypothetical protein
VTATWATVLTAGLALAAAGASWASVWQNRKQIKASLEPDLQVLIEGGRGSDHLGLYVRNTGEVADSAYDDIAVKVYASRSWLTVPGTI